MKIRSVFALAEEHNEHIMRLATDNDVSSAGFDTEEFFEKLGREVVEINCVGRLERAFRCLGSNLEDFLTTLDSVQDVLQQEAEADSDSEQKNVNGDVEDDVSDWDQPGFLCTTRSPEDSALGIHFTVSSPGTAFLFAGTVKAVAEKLYGTKVDIRQSSNDSVHYR